MDWKDVLVRAAKTAVEAFLVAVPVNVIMQAIQEDGVDAALALASAAAIAAGAAGLTVVWNAILQWTQSK